MIASGLRSLESGPWPWPRPRPRTTFKAKDLDPKAKAKDLSHKAKAKDLDFGLKDQGQGLTSLLTRNFQRHCIAEKFADKIASSGFIA